MRATHFGKRSKTRATKQFELHRAQRAGELLPEESDGDKERLRRGIETAPPASVTGASLIGGGVLSLLFSGVVWLLADIRTALQGKAQQ